MPYCNSIDTLESIGRTCYKSEDKIQPGSSEKFISKIIQNGHESIIEHVPASIRFIISRSTSHELVRHRLASFSQESQRYVNYKDKDIEFIRPVWLDITLDETHNYSFETWEFLQMLQVAEHNYKKLIEWGWRPEQAREILPNAVKTELVMTANLREWRHIFKLRTSNKAHPQIRELMKSILNGFIDIMPLIFEDLKED